MGLKRSANTQIYDAHHLITRVGQKNIAKTQVKDANSLFAGDQTMACETVVDIKAICDQLLEEGNRRKSVIVGRMRITNQILAYVVRYLGGYRGESEEERKRLWAEAAKVVKRIEEGEEHPAAMFVLSMGEAKQNLLKVQAVHEKAMCLLVRQLPVYNWWMSIKGLGEIGLATLLAETGNLNCYPTVSHLWKRLGVAPDSEYHMVTKAGKIVPAKPRRRRSVLWNIGDSLIKTNGENGYYRKLYLARKAYLCKRDPELTKPGKKLKAHRQAQRYMEKRLVKHLWQKWRGQEFED